MANTSVSWPSNAAIFALAEPLIKQFEGLRLTAYLCPANKWTIGYGCTRHPNGQPVKEGEMIMLADATAYLESAMGRVLNDMETDGAITRSPTAPQAAAFLSLAYNVGLGIHDGKSGDLADSTLFRLFNANDNSCAARFLDWDKAHVHGVVTVLPGLESRRKAEMALFERAA